VSARDELAELVYKGMFTDPNEPGIRPMPECPHWQQDIYYRTADRVLAAGFKKVTA